MTNLFLLAFLQLWFQKRPLGETCSIRIFKFWFFKIDNWVAFEKESLPLKKWEFEYEYCYNLCWFSLLYQKTFPLWKLFGKLQNNNDLENNHDIWFERMLNHSSHLHFKFGFNSQIRINWKEIILAKPEWISWISSNYLKFHFKVSKIPHKWNFKKKKTTVGKSGKEKNLLFLSFQKTPFNWKVDMNFTDNYIDSFSFGNSFLMNHFSGVGENLLSGIFMRGFLKQTEAFVRDRDIKKIASKLLSKTFVRSFTTRSATTTKIEKRSPNFQSKTFFENKQSTNNIIIKSINKAMSTAKNVTDSVWGFFFFFFFFSWRKKNRTECSVFEKKEIFFSFDWFLELMISYYVYLLFWVKFLWFVVDLRII